MKNARTFKYSFKRIIIFTIFCILLLQLSTSAVALTQINTNSVEQRQGAVLLIVDGLGSSYIDKERTPYAIDGSPLKSAETKNITAFGSKGMKVSNILIPSIEGENGHSVIFTGNPDATSVMLSYTGASVYDIARDNGYLMFAIFEKGESSELLAKQNIAAYDSTTSINDPQIEMVSNHFEVQDITPSINDDIETVLKEQATLAPAYVQQYPEGSIERYNAYNNWAIISAIKIVDVMEKYPEQKYILTINVGAIDTAGLYRKNIGYIDCIEEFDIMIQPLFERTEDNGLAFVLTADHGMAFQSEDGRGGSKSGSYATTPEVLLVPFIAISPNMNKLSINDQVGQENIAPTLLSILDLPNELRFSTGNSFADKEYVNFKIILEEPGNIAILSEEEIIVEANGDTEYIIFGLEKDKEYSIRADLSGNYKDEKEGSMQGDQTQTGIIQERIVDATSDKVIHIGTNGEVENERTKDVLPKGTRKTIGSLLIIFINLTGLALIFKIVKS